MASTLVKKLLLKPGYKVCILHAPDGYTEELGEIPQGAEIVNTPVAGCDFVQLFVKNSAELDQYLDEAIATIKADGLLWICYPKKSSKMKSDLSRDHLNALVKDTGFQGVSLISINETWSAMRFKPIK